jgi:hypothetical protein
MQGSMLLGSTLLLAGCAASVGELAMISPQDIPGSAPVLRRGVTAEDCAHKIIGIPLGESAPNLNLAVARALAQVPGGVMLTNATIDNDYAITVLYNRNCIRVTGDVVGG